MLAWMCNVPQTGLSVVMIVFEALDSEAQGVRVRRGPLCRHVVGRPFRR